MSKQKDFCLKAKCGMLEKYDDLPKRSLKETALKFRNSWFTLCSLLKNRDNINPPTVTNGNTYHKNMEAGKAKGIKAVLDWFKNVTLKKIPISLRILCKKEEKFMLMLGLKILLLLMVGWLNGKSKTIFVYYKLHREKQDMHFDAAGYGKTYVLLNLLKDCDPLLIFDVDETGLFNNSLSQCYDLEVMI